MSYSLEIKNKEVVIKLPLIEKTSKSGKNTVIATTSGNQVTDIKFKDKLVVLGVNVYIRK